MNANTSSVDRPENDGGGTLMKSIDAAADTPFAIDMAAVEVVFGDGSETAAGGDDDSASTSMLTARYF